MMERGGQKIADDYKFRGDSDFNFIGEEFDEDLPKRSKIVDDASVLEWVILDFLPFIAKAIVLR